MVRGYSTDAVHFQCAIFDNTIVLLVCPLKFCITIVFVFSWDHFKSQEKLQTMLMQNLGGQTKSIMVFFEVVYIFFCNNALHFDLRDMPSEELLEDYCSILHSKSPSF